MLIVGILVAIQLQAEVYKSVDEKGNVLYTDQPLEGAMPVILPKPSVYTPGPLPSYSEEATPPKQSDGTAYTTLSITSPEPNATLFNGEGTVQVQLALIPALNLNAGHKLIIELDGTRMVGTGTTFSLGNIERGSHTVRAEVVDESGSALITSEPVTFYFRQPSLFMPKNPNNPANKPKPNPPPAT